MTAAAPSGALVRFEHVGVTFPDGTTALSDVSLTVQPGDFVTIVGPSGCGKTTLLRLAAGLATPTSGTIAVDRDALAFVFQEPTLLPWRTVRRNVELVPELHRVPPAERARLAAAAIELVGLAGHEHRYPRTLSGGMQMRVSLARALTLSPRLFLLDEPFGALDEITRERLDDELLGLFERQRFGALFVTHSVQEAVYLGSRVVVLSARPGRVVAELDVPFGYPRPARLRADAAFAGLAGLVSDALREAVP